MEPTINFCPVCRCPVNGNREGDIDRLADRLRTAHLKRKLGDTYIVETLPWEDLQDSERARWRDDAETAIAALDVR